MSIGKTINELEEGESADFTKTVTETDVTLFTAISGATDPMFLNKEFAKETEHGKRIVPSSVYSSFIAPLLGMNLPGLGTIVVNLKANFSKPVFIGDTITARVIVDEIDKESGTVKMALKWENQKDEQIGEGEATVMPPKEEYKEFF